MLFDECFKSGSSGGSVVLFAGLFSGSMGFQAPADVVWEGGFDCLQWCFDLWDFLSVFWWGGTSQVDGEFSATVPSLLPSGTTLLDFSSTSGVLGFAIVLPVPKWSGLGLESSPGSGVPLMTGSGVAGLGASGVGARVVSGTGVVALGVAGLASGLELGRGFGSAVLRPAVGSGLGSGLGFKSAFLLISNFTSSGFSEVVLISGSGLTLVSGSGLGLISTVGGALGLDSAEDG